MAEKEKWPKVIQEAYVAWDMMRRLGFPSDDLFFEVDRENHTAIVLHPGRDMSREKAFVITCGKAEAPTETVFALWRKFAEDLPKMDEKELAEFYRGSEISEMGFILVRALARRGIDMPVAVERRE